MTDPNTLTGEFVENFRLERKMKRQPFNDICVHFGLNAGRSLARMCNIEKNDIWKKGDREAVAQAIDHILSGAELPPPPAVTQLSNVDSQEFQTDSAPRTTKDPGDPFAASKRFLAGVTADNAPPVPVWCDEDDEIDESFVNLTSEALTDVDFDALLDQSSVAQPIDLTSLPDEEDLTSWAALEPDFMPAAEEVDDDNVFTITNSQVQTAKRCKRKWWLGWYRGLAPRHENLLNVRATGSRVHKALQAWYVPDGMTPVDPRDALERILTEDWTRIVTAATERGHDEFVIADLTDKFNKSAGLERAMIEGYVQWLQETGADSQLKIIASETTLKAHLYDHVRSDGQVVPVQAMGLLDVRAYRTTDGANLFVDHKTVGDLKSPVAMLPQNEQMIHYLLLEWLSSEDGETHCDGALYNMMRRVKRTTTAKPPFYDRYEVRHNQFELESYKRRLIAETRDIMHMIETLDAGADPMDVAYPSPTKDCTWGCDFFSICSMFDDGSRVEDALESLFVEVDPNAHYEPTKGIGE